MSDEGDGDIQDTDMDKEIWKDEEADEEIMKFYAGEKLQVIHYLKGKHGNMEHIEMTKYCNAQ